MTKQEFMKYWTKTRSAAIKRAVQAGEWRPSEGTMALMDLPADGSRIWRKLRVTLRHHPLASLNGLRGVAADDH